MNFILRESLALEDTAVRIRPKNTLVVFCMARIEVTSSRSEHERYQEMRPVPPSQKHCTLKQLGFDGLILDRFGHFLYMFVV